MNNIMNDLQSVSVRNVINGKESNFLASHHRKSSNHDRVNE